MASKPRIGLPSDLIFPILSNFELNFSAISISGTNTRLWFFRVFLSFLYILLISDVKIKRTFPRHELGTCLSHSSENSFFSLKSPSSAGTNFSFISTNHPGCVKSPVPTMVIPFNWAAIYRFSRSRFFAVALENFE